MTAVSSAAEEAPVAAPLVGRPDVNRKRMARLGWMFTAPALIIVAGRHHLPDRLLGGDKPVERDRVG